jgi:hypothetical protein
VRRQAPRREKGYNLKLWEGLEGGGRRVTRSIFQTGSEPERPRLVKPAVEDAERDLIVSGDGHDLAIRDHSPINPDEEAVLSQPGGRDLSPIGPHCLAESVSRPLV